MVPPHLIKDEDGLRAGRDVDGNFLRWPFITALLQRGMTIPAPLPSAGQIAPKIQAEAQRCVRYRGRSRNTCHLHLMCAAINLRRALVLTA
ncbi:hypothetical protein FBZ92_11077 [Nitrospirillum viridazoti]|uniref:Uncharacterized protein n=1 Tax=Nitrospirillum amazonense TaxID=28077 RepID=A0A560IC82_9PROT|nr:hypothetical protein FBZ92_11077 [Nitrospirillum amazonense]